MGSLRLVTGSYSSVECELLELADPGALVQAIANLRELRTTTRGVNLGIGFRPSLWRHIAPQELPAGVSDFEQEACGVNILLAALLAGCHRHIALARSAAEESGT